MDPENRGTPFRTTNVVNLGVRKLTPIRSTLDPEPNLTEQSNLPLLREELSTHMHKLKKIAVLFFWIFIALAWYVGYSWQYTENEILVAIGGIACIGIIASVILVTSLKEDAYGAATLVGYYILVIVFGCLVCFGSAAYFFHGESLDQLSMQSEDESYWESTFPNMTPEEVHQQQQQVLQNAGLISLVVAGVLLLSLIPFCKLAWDMQSIHVITQVFVFTLALFAIALGLRSLICIKYYEEKDVAEIVNDWIPNTLLYISISLLILCLVIFMAIYKDAVSAMMISAFLILALGCAAGYLSYESFSVTPNFDTDFNCRDVMARYTNGQLDALGCTNKFTDKAPAITQLICDDKLMMVENWDPEGGVACLNAKCCTVLQNAVRVGFDYMAALAAAVFGTSVIIFGLSLITRHEINAEKEWDQDSRKGELVILILINLLLVAAIGFAFWQIIPSVEVIYPGDIEPIGKVLGAGLVPMSYLAGHARGHSACTSMAVNLTDFSESTLCDECKNTLDIQIHVHKGEIYLDDEPHGDSFSFQGDSEVEVQALLNGLLFCPICIDEAGHVEIQSTVLKDTPITSYETGVLETHIDQIPEQLEGFRIDLPFPKGKKSQGIAFHIFDPEKKQLDGVEISANTAGCEKTSTAKTDKSGYARLQFDTPVGFEPLETTVKFAKEGFVDGVLPLQVGGLPLIQNRIKTFRMVADDKAFGSLQVNAFDSSNNKRIGGRMRIHGGGRTHTDLSQVPAGIYELTVEQNGYISNEATVSINSNSTFVSNIDLVPDNLSQDQVVFTINWSKFPVDIDLHAYFQTNTTVWCHVFYGHKHCGGAEMLSHTHSGGENGGEALTIDASPTYYLIYATADRSLNWQNVTEPATLSTSGAYISVFSAASDNSLMQFSIPYRKKEYTAWFALCYDGRQGVTSVFPLSRMARDDSNLAKMYEECGNVYGLVDNFEGEQNAETNTKIFNNPIP